MISRELIHRIRRIEIRTSHLVDELFAGRYRSAFKGQGIEFEEVRPYQPGDEVRTIDWKVTARSRLPYVKLFREERELTIHLLVDVSGSQFFGTTSQSKRELAVDISAMLAFAALRNSDKIGLTLFSDRIEHTVRSATGLRHVLRVIRDLLTVNPQGRKTDLSFALTDFHRKNPRRTVLFVLSDFLTAGYESALRIVAARHDVVPIAIRDRREMELPAGGLLRVADPETGGYYMLDASSRRQRQDYARLAESEERQWQRLFRQLHLDWLDLWTGEDPIPALTRFLNKRGNRR
jgi:uncharacterized protein (DUF58 family)